MTAFADRALSKDRPKSLLAQVELPRRQAYFPSPSDWRDHVIYFLLVDRFSDGQEAERPLLDRANLWAFRPSSPGGQVWRWDQWAASGSDRFQGGTLAGVTSKLDYLANLGVTTLWLSPVFKQRTDLDSYHGYGMQDFLDVDPHFGTRQDLVDLVAAAHNAGLRVLLDVIFNHSGPNWVYPEKTPGGPYTPAYTTGRYAFGSWLGGQGQSIPAIRTGDDGVWPVELQNPESYTRAGTGNLGSGDIDDPNAENKRSDFMTLRDMNLSDPAVLNDLARCYKYWIALTDCDGFRIDTLKHVSYDQGRNFCGAIKEFAAQLGKLNFLLIGEIAGGDYDEEHVLDALARNLNAALDIGEMKVALNQVAKGLLNPRAYFDGFTPGLEIMGSSRNLGDKHVSILDDHDNVFGDKIRFAAEAATAYQGIAGTAAQLFTLGLPCLYYGTEQAFAGPEAAERPWLPDWKSSDRYLREAMFGPAHPCRHGSGGLPSVPDPKDPDLPGFGPFGTAGGHCFDPEHPLYRRMAALLAARRAYPALRYGRQYLRPISFLGKPFDVYGPGELLAWSRILDDEEILIIINAHGTEARGAAVLIDSTLNAEGSSFTVLANSAQAADPAGYQGPYKAGMSLPVERTPDGIACLTIADWPPSEVLVLGAHPAPDPGDILP